MLKRIEGKKQVFKQNLYMKFHSSSIHKSQKVKTTQISINRRLDQQTVVCPHNGIVLSHKKELSTIQTLQH